MQEYCPGNCVSNRKIRKTPKFYSPKLPFNCCVILIILILIFTLFIVYALACICAAYLYQNKIKRDNRAVLNAFQFLST